MAIGDAKDDETAITMALNLIAEADEQVYCRADAGMDTSEAERLVEKMQALLEELRQTAKDRSK
jgi:hypothetical protein